MGLENVYVPDVVSEKDRDYFKKSGFGARMGWGDTPALLIVDMTRQFTTNEYALGRTDTGRKAVEATDKLLDVARDAGIPIVYTRGMNCPNAVEYTGIWMEKLDTPPNQVEGNEIDPELEPREDEIVIEKGGASAFFDTRLASLLRYYGVDTVIVTGMVTSGCVRATVVDACSNNFHTIVPKECVADRAEISQEIALFEMDLKYADVASLVDVTEELESFVSAPVDE